VPSSYPARAPRSPTVMRHAGVIAILLVSICVASCTSTHLYSSTAASTTTYPFDWAPLGKDGEYALTPAENERRTADLDQCVRTLADMPEHEIRRTRDQRLFQMVDCMEAKGWHIVRYSVVVTG
jgi:hypothetical protein